MQRKATSSMARKRAESSKPGRRRTARPVEPDPDWYVCPGTGWGPDEETCGTLIRPREMRCADCSAKRTALRKQDRALSQKKAADKAGLLEPATADQQPWNMW